MDAAMKLCLLPPAGEKLSAALAVALAAAGLTGAASHASRLYLPHSALYGKRQRGGLGFEGTSARLESIALW